MIRFAQFEYLYFLALLPAAMILTLLMAYARKKAMTRFAELNILDRLSESKSKVARPVKLTVFMLAMAFLIVGLANPQIGTKMKEVQQEGVDLFIALDVSLSMKAEDIKPNRLEKAKLEIRNLIDRLGGDRIGLIVFAGEAYTQFPLTTDYAAANLFIDAVETDTVPTPGTSLRSAIAQALESFDFKTPSTKVIVLITDGENTEGDGFSAAKEAAEKGVIIYTIGMGSPSGVPIPIYNATGQHDFKRDANGNVVVTKLDELSLEKMAMMGHGGYYRATNAVDALGEVYKKISGLQKHQFGVKQFTDFEDRFQFFIGIGIFLLLVELFISENKVLWLAKWNLFLQ